MPFNPRLHSQDAAVKGNRQRIVGPNAGLTHADAVKNVGSALLAKANRVPTPTGFSVEVFNSTDFIVREEYIAERNNTGLGVNKKSDRGIFVQKGVLFVNIKDNKELQTLKLYQGQSILLKKNTTYGLSTLATEAVELIVTETPNYKDNWKVVKKPDSTNNHVTSRPVSTRSFPAKDAAVDAQSKLQGAEMANIRAGREVAATGKHPHFVSNSTSVVGVNPKPYIPSSE